MKNYLLIFIISFVLYSCSETEIEQNKVIGEITNYDPSGTVKEFYLFELTPSAFMPIDTVLVQENGVFTFNVPRKKKGLYTLGLAPTNAITVYLDSNTKEQTFKINDLNRLSKNYSTNGNEISEKIANFTSEVNKMMTLGSVLNKEAKKLSFNDTVSLKKLYDEFQIESEKFLEIRNNFIDKNMDNPALIAAVDQIDPKQEFDLFKEVIIDGLGKTMPNSIHYKGMKAYLMQFEAKQAEEERKKNHLKAGTPAPDLNFPDVNGNNLALSSLKGKVVLLDFWASWCGPCRKENPNVVNLYNRYNGQGFEVFSFSLDKDKQKWINAIAQDGLVWKSHTSDLKGWQTAAIPVYGFNSIPFTVLIDRKGNIIAKNLRGKALEDKLAELF